jgi:hypothetical protein
MVAKSVSPPPRGPGLVDPTTGGLPTLSYWVHEIHPENSWNYQARTEMPSQAGVTELRWCLSPGHFAINWGQCENELIEKKANVKMRKDETSFDALDSAVSLI